MQRLLSFLCVSIVIVGCQTTENNKWHPTKATRIVLQAEQFRGFWPRIQIKDLFCGEIEETYWVASTGTAEIALTTADPGCVVFDASPTIDDLIQEWRWLRQGPAKQEKDSIMIKSLGAPVWVHFLRRKEMPCILFRFGIGDSGDSINGSTQRIRGYYCSQSSKEISARDAAAFVKSIKILDEPAQYQPTT